MPSRTILGIKPGARHIGYALFQSSELSDWGIKVVKGKWTAEKKEKIEGIFKTFLDECKPDCLALKKLHSARSSPELAEAVKKLKELCRIRNIPVYEYPIQYLEKIILTGKLNKKELVEAVYQQYPALFSEYEKQRLTILENEKKRSNKTGYYLTLFEAVALGHVCFNQIDKQ